MIQKLLYFTFCFCTLIGNAQNSTPPYAVPQMDLHATLALPFSNAIIPDSATSTALVAFGFGGGFTAPFSKSSLLADSPLRLGFSFRYLWQGNEKKDFLFIDDQGFEYELESKVKGTMSPLQIMARLDPMNYSRFPVLPYAGGFVGLRFFGTNQKITVDYLDGSEPLVENNREMSITTTYGFELGLHARITPEVMLDFRVERAYGGWAKYVDLSSVQIDDNGNATYDRIESRTDMDMFTLGLVVLIND
jgi:hypothetical protein|tara:strand:+ start:104 stop:847 length:744 start_codon:yes stop_codon:yes gene_type:complete